MGGKIKADVSLSERDKGPLATATIKYANLVTVSGYTVWAKKDGSGYFVLPPQLDDAKPGAKYTDKVYAIDAELRRSISETILEEFEGMRSRETAYDVSVYAYKEPHGAGLAQADVTFNGELVVKGFRVYQGKDSIQVALPREKSYKDKEGAWHDGREIVGSLRKGLTPALVQRIKEEYEAQKGKGAFEKDYDQQKSAAPAVMEKDAGQAPSIGDADLTQDTER
jgi:DNA-binding cell septation regulator SpoVG